MGSEERLPSGGDLALVAGIIAGGVIWWASSQETPTADLNLYLKNPTSISQGVSDNGSLTPLETLIQEIGSPESYPEKPFPSIEIRPNEAVIDSIVDFRLPRVIQEAGNSNYDEFVYNLRILEDRGYFKELYDTSVTTQAYTLFTFLTGLIKSEPNENPKEFFDIVSRVLPAYLHLASMKFLEKKDSFGEELLIRPEFALDAFIISHERWQNTEWSTAGVRSPVKSAFEGILKGPYPTALEKQVWDPIFDYSNRQRKI